MFEVGFTEIILILGLALLVLGPEKLPGLADKVGRWTGRARAMARQLRSQLEQEVTLEELAKSTPQRRRQRRFTRARRPI
jgi:sec-independent protein translocase protein TatB